MTAGAKQQVTGRRSPVLKAHRLSLPRIDLGLRWQGTICG
jgi:hypothetical protein